MRDGSEIMIVHCAREETPFRERASPRMLDSVVAALSRHGRPASVSRYSTHHRAAAASLRGRRVFNMAYGYIDPLSGRSFSQPEVALRLAELGAGLIGSNAASLSIAQDKLRCAELLGQHGIESPRAMSTADDPDSLVIRKPRHGACHRDVAILRLAEALKMPPAPDVLLQEYVDGPEYTIGVVAGRALPPARVLIAGARGPAALGATPGEIELEPGLDAPASLAGVVERIGQILGLSDYYRVDVRLRDGAPVILDVNGLPNLDPDASFLALLAGLAGWTYDDLVLAIVDSAERRWRSTPGPA